MLFTSSVFHSLLEKMLITPGLSLNTGRALVHVGVLRLNRSHFSEYLPMPVGLTVSIRKPLTLHSEPLEQVNLSGVLLSLGPDWEFL